MNKVLNSIGKGASGFFRLYKSIFTHIKAKGLSKKDADGAIGQLAVYLLGATVLTTGLVNLARDNHTLFTGAHMGAGLIEGVFTLGGTFIVSVMATAVAGAGAGYIGRFKMDIREGRDKRKQAAEEKRLADELALEQKIARELKAFTQGVEKEFNVIKNPIRLKPGANVPKNHKPET